MFVPFPKKPKLRKKLGCYILIQFNDFRIEENNFWMREKGFVINDPSRVNDLALAYNLYKRVH